MREMIIGTVAGVMLSILTVVLLYLFVLDSSRRTDMPQGIACTEEAMLCSDGTAVGRTGPNCEFAPCPNLEQEEEQSKPAPFFIVVHEPKQNDVITSPLVIRGEARGTWYFEARFPVALEDENGKIIATGTAEAEGEWMTESFVPFIATLAYVSEKEQSGILVLRNDNPSGLSENAHELRVSVILSPSLQSTDGGVSVAPLDRASERVTKKPFGIFIDSKTSPVQPERFGGYHTGTDFEMFPDEKTIDVSVRAVCTGELEVKRRASGYGGLVVQRCTMDRKAVSIIYGHLALSSVTAERGDILARGTTIGVLGMAESTDTDGERKHLHLGIFKGIGTASILGYVASQQELDQWLDPCLFVCK